MAPELVVNDSLMHYLAEPKQGLILHKATQGVRMSKRNALILLAHDISFELKVAEGYDPAPYMNEALGLGLERQGNLAYLLFTNKTEPEAKLDLPNCYMVSPNGRFYYGLRVDGAIYPLTHTLGELAFSLDEKLIAEKERRYSSRREASKPQHADDAIAQVDFGNPDNTEVIFPIAFFPSEQNDAVAMLSRVGSDMADRDYRLKDYFVMTAARAGELLGVEGHFDATFWYQQ